MLLPFRTVTRGRLKRARWTFFIIAASAAAVYGATALRYAYPGASANWIAWAAGLDGQEVPIRPLFILLGHWAASLPYGELTCRLNLLSAVAGALTVGWIYKVVWFLVFDSMREESAATQASRTARFGGLSAALATALSLPFWQASTRFSPQVFDAAWMMACAHLLTVYARAQNALWLSTFGVLCGLGAAESPAALIAAPVLLTLAVITEWKLSWCRMGRLISALALTVLSAIALHVLSIYRFLSAQNIPFSFREGMTTFVSILRAQLDAAIHLIPATGWFPVLALGIGSAFLSLLCALRMLNNRRTWSVFFTGGLLTLSAVWMLLNAPLTPWAALSPQGAVLATTYTLYGLGLGLLTASWRALASMDDPAGAATESPPDDEEEDEKRPKETGNTQLFSLSRLTGFALAPALFALIAAAGIRNAWQLKRDDASFIDRAADTVLDGLKGRTWIVTNGFMDPNLLIRAHARKLGIHLLCPYRARESFYTAQVLRDLLRDASFSPSIKQRAQSMATYNFHMFIDDLFAADEHIGDKAVCMGVPDIWYGSGWTPVPECLFYGGTKNTAGIDALGVFRHHMRFWNQCAPFLDQSDAPVQFISHKYRMALRHHIAFLANNLGVTLEDLNRPEEAFTAFQLARTTAPDNVSALLNVYDLVSRGLHPELKDSVTRELRRRIDNPHDRYPLWSLSRTFGYVRNYEFFVRRGWTWALSSCPSSVLAGLRSVYSVQQDNERQTAMTAMMASIYEMRGEWSKSETEYRKTLQRDPQNTTAISGLVRLALQQSVIGTAQKVLEASEQAGVSRRQLRRDWAAVYLVSGDLPRARVLLQELSDEPNVAPMTMAMLAMVMIEQGEAASVEHSVLPNLIKIATGADMYFVHVVQGKIWQSKGAAGFGAARQSFLRAIAVRPDIQALRDIVLMLDVSLKDKKAAEAHALYILRQRPNQPLANFVLGSIRLEQGQFGEAESYLRLSADTPEPTVAALNNYAQVLCRIRRLDEAETVARKAIKQAPARYEVWSTLAFVLAVRGRIQEADEALNQAYQRNRDDPRLALVDGLIAINRGDRQTLGKAIQIVEQVPDLSAADRAQLETLKAAYQHGLNTVR